jgi:thiol-disulfide isomerase/thioredoxin
MILRLLFFLAAIAFFSVSLSAQEVEIRVKIQGLSTDTVWLGETYGKRAIPLYPSLRQPDGWATIKVPTALPDGMYAIIYRRGAKARNSYVPIMLDATEKQFSIDMPMDQPHELAAIVGSPTNQAFFAYYGRMNKMLDDRDSLNDRYMLHEDEASFKALVAYENTIAALQKRTIQTQKGSTLAQWVEWTSLPEYELKTPWPVAQLERRNIHNQLFVKQLGSAPLSNYMRSPLWIERMDIVTFKLWNNPDSSAVYARQILNTMQRDTACFHYYFNYMVNSFGSMSKYGLDQVFITLVNDFIRAGKAPWTEEGDKTKMGRQADDMVPLLVGKRAPNATLTDFLGNPVVLDDIKANYTLLVFWDPSCGHCKKELPVLARIMPKYYPKDLKVVTYCSAREDGIIGCRSVRDTLALPTTDEWMYLYDPTNTARVPKLYNLRTFPRLYLLDRNKTIIYRRSGEVSEEELNVMFDRLIK